MAGNSVILDSGPLIVLSDKAHWSRGRAWLKAIDEEQVLGLVPPAVVTEFIRGSSDWRRADWWLSHLTRIETSAEIGRAAGLLLRMLRDSRVSIVDAHVAQHAISLNAPVLTSDPHDIRRLLDAAGASIDVFELPWPA